jgi:hypothetical protein
MKDSRTAVAVEQHDEVGPRLGAFRSAGSIAAPASSHAAAYGTHDVEPVLREQGGEGAQPGPHRQVVPEQADPLVPDPAHAAGDPVVQLVSKHPVITVALLRAPKGDDRRHVEEGVEPGPRGRHGPPGRKAFRPKERAFAGEPDRFGDRGGVRGASGDARRGLREIPNLPGEVLQVAGLRPAVQERGVDNRQRDPQPVRKRFEPV